MTAGTPGVTYLLSDTFTWEIEGDNWVQDPKQSYYGVAMPLIDDGIPLEVGAMDYIQSAEDLAGVSLLIVSYDSMKPLSEQVNRAIADWVKQGGALLYVGGNDAYAGVSSEWWNQAGKGGSPYNNLLSHLGLTSITAEAFEGLAMLEYAGPDSMASLFEGKMGLINDAYGYTVSYSGEGFTPLLHSDVGDALAIEAKVGKGHFLSVGLPGYYFASTQQGADWIKAICEYAMQYTDYRYVSSPVMRADRGEYTAVHALSEDYTLEGVYVDLFDSSLPVVINPVVTAGTSGLFYQVDSTGGTPSVAFFGGTLQETIVETPDRTSLSLTGPANSVSSIRLLGEGKIPAQIRASLGGQEYTRILTQWSNATSSLLIEVNNSAGLPIDIVVDWENGEKPDDPPRSFEEKIIAAGLQGNDQDYIVRFTGASLAGSHYCDMSAELVYRLDLSEYPGAWITLNVSNNYVISLSDHDGDWVEAYNYKTLSGGDIASSGNNMTSLTIQPGDYGLSKVVYLRLSNCYPDRGWGGAIHSTSIHYVATR